MQKPTKYLFAFLSIVTSIICVHYKYMNDYPIYTHGWTQADKLSIADGFINNNYHFFKPETYILNKQFPSNYYKASNNAITSVDFPLHEYVVAIIMKVTNNNSPAIYKWYSILLSFLGLFFLFKTILFLTDRFVISLLATLLCAFYPVYFYYLNTPIPSNLGLSSLFIGLYFYILHLSNNRSKYHHWAYVFFTFSSLIRTSLFVFLFAIYLMEFVHYYYSKKSIKWRSILFSFVCILSYFLYNKYLSRLYGSIFLADIIPFESYQEFTDLIKTKLETVHEVYFSKAQWWVFIIGVILGLMTLRSKSYLLKSTTILAFLLLAGYFSFFLLMGKQFAEHDYYFIDTLFLPMIFFTIVGVAAVVSTSFSPRNVLLSFLLGYTVLLSYQNARSTYENRKIVFHYDKISIATLCYQDGDSLLSSNHISRKEKVIALGSYSPNNALYGLKRQGYAQVHNSLTQIKKALSFPSEWVIVPNALFYDHIYVQNPELFHHLQYIATNNKITLFKKSDTILDIHTFDDLMHFTHPAFQLSLHEDSLSSIATTRDVSKLNDSIIITSNANTYENIIEFSPSLIKKSPYWVKIEATIFSSRENIFNNAHFEIHLSHKTKLKYWYINNSTHIHTKANEWNSITTYLYIPNFVPFDEVRILFLNKEAELIQWKNLTLSFYN